MDKYQVVVTVTYKVHARSRGKALEQIEEALYPALAQVQREAQAYGLKIGGLAVEKVEEGSR